MNRWLTLVMVLSVALAACAGVLGHKGKNQQHPFEHRAHVLKGVNCKECHAGVNAAGELDDVHFPTPTDCVRCHDKPHDTRDCRTCHTEPWVRESAELARKHLRFEHSKHMTQVKGDCVRCHLGVQESNPTALRPAMATCFGCHAHRDQWQVRDCDGCHVDLGAERVKPTSHLVHEGDFVREHGVRAASARELCSSCHAEKFCASCHAVGTAPLLPARREFDEPKLAGLHRAGFRARHSEEARAQPGVCTSCHSESSCKDCHSRLNVAAGGKARNPHPPDWMGPSRGGQHGIQARIDPASCAGCHGGAGEQLCVSCHRVGGPGGNPHGGNFHSTKNKTRDVPCKMCHAGSL